MYSLTNTAAYSRKASVWVAIGIGAIILLLVMFAFSKSIINAIFPPPPTPATVSFGKLPKLDLSEGVKLHGQISYSLETISGDLPNISAYTKVFRINPQELTFGSLDKAKIMAAKVGFTKEPQQINTNVYQFSDQQGEKNLLVDITNGNFRLESKYQNDLNIIASHPESTQNAIDRARNFLNNFNFDPREFPAEKIETKLYKLDSGNLADAVVLPNANIVKVDFNRADIDKIPLISPQEKESLVTAIVSQKNVVAGELNRENIEFNDFATYPLKGTTKAFEELKSGVGAFNGELKGNTFPIRNVSLAYLETKKPQNFLQPVYVFESDNGLFAYISAIDENWVAN